MIKLDFNELKAMGFQVEEVDDGVLINPMETDDTLAREMHHVLSRQEFTSIEHDVIIEAAIAAQNRILITKAMKQG